MRAQIDQLYLSTPRALMGATVAALGLVAVQWQVVSPSALRAWLVAVLLINLLRWQLTRVYRRRVPTDAELIAWAYRHAGSTAIAGIVWAFPILFLWPQASPTHQLIWCIGIMPLSAATIVTYYAFKPAYLAFLLPTALVIAARLTAEDGYVFGVLGMLAFYFTYVLAKAGRHVHETALAMLQSRYTEQALNRQLQEEIVQHKQLQRDLAERNAALEQALSKVRQLSGLLPICGTCKKIRNDQGYWQQLESFIRERSSAQFSHGICPDCAHQQYPEIFP